MLASSDPGEWRPPQAETPLEQLLNKLRAYGQGHGEEHMPTEAEVSRLTPGQIQDCFAWLAHHVNRREQKVTAALTFIEESGAGVIEAITIDMPETNTWRAIIKAIPPDNPTGFEFIGGTGPSIALAIFNVAEKLQSWLIRNYLPIADDLYKKATNGPSQ